MKAIINPKKNPFRNTLAARRYNEFSNNTNVYESGIDTNGMVYFAWTNGNVDRYTREDFIRKSKEYYENMKRYSFTYVNSYGNGNIVDEKYFSSDEEAKDHGMQLLEIAMRDDQRENAPSPYVIVDKLDDDADDDDDPIASFSINL